MRKLRNTLYVITPDKYLSLDGENIVMHSKDDTQTRLPLHNVEDIVIFGGRGASPALMNKCTEDNIGLTFMSRSGKFLARAEGAISGNVYLRREQFRIADDEARSLSVAKNFIIGKLFNSRYVIERAVRDHSLQVDVDKLKNRSDLLSQAIIKCQSVSDIDTLRGIEGESAQLYFSVFDEFILQQKDEFRFVTRSKRPPLDNVNALLSFSYSVATGMCTSALETVGLDPYVGFMHTDRPGRRSLALDLVEEFRAIMCDRFVISLINKRIINNGDFEKKEDGAVLLSEDGRKVFLTHWQNRKQDIVMHPFLKEKVEWGLLPYIQALLLSRYIRGDLDEYPMLLWSSYASVNNL